MDVAVVEALDPVGRLGHPDELGDGYSLSKGTIRFTTEMPLPDEAARSWATAPWTGHPWIAYPGRAVLDIDHDLGLSGNQLEPPMYAGVLPDSLQPRSHRPDSPAPRARDEIRIGQVHAQPDGNRFLMLTPVGANGAAAGW